MQKPSHERLSSRGWRSNFKEWVSVWYYNTISAKTQLLSQFVTQVKDLLSQSSSNFGNDSRMRWLGYSSDLWTSQVMDGALGLSLRCITWDFVPITIVATLVKMNSSHSCINLTNKTDWHLQQALQYWLACCSFWRGKWYRKHDKCLLHIVSLLMACSIGMKENCKTKKVVIEDGKEVKTRIAITPGSVFPFGVNICKKLKDLADYFGHSPLQKESLSLWRRVHCP